MSASLFRRCSRSFSFPVDVFRPWNPFVIYNILNHFFPFGNRFFQIPLKWLSGLGVPFNGALWRKVR
jgi:hypothetical protein